MNPTQTMAEPGQTFAPQRRNGRRNYKPNTNFNNYVQEANEFLGEVCDTLRTDNKDQAFRILRAVLHTLRDRIAMQESLHLISQLPMIIKAVYIDGWKAGELKRLKTVDEFLREVVRNNRGGALKDFKTIEQTEFAVQAIFEVLQNHVTKGEIDHIIQHFPEELQEFLFPAPHGLTDQPRRRGWRPESMDDVRNFRGSYPELGYMGEEPMPIPIRQPGRVPVDAMWFGGPDMYAPEPFLVDEDYTSPQGRPMPEGRRQPDFGRYEDDEPYYDRGPRSYQRRGNYDNYPRRNEPQRNGYRRDSWMYPPEW